MRRLSRVAALAVLAMLGTLLVFFLPAHGGAFTVTHGPATAFRALTAARRLFAAISAVLLFATGRSSIRPASAATPVIVTTGHPQFLTLRC